MELGARRDATVSLPDPILVKGDEIVVDVPIEVCEFEAMAMPVVDRTVEVCLRLLERQGLAADRIGRMVLVGGPTVMPALRARLQERLGVELATDVDPMTAVAEGAARFAAEHGLSTRAKDTQGHASPGVGGVDTRAVKGA
jgi:molecular chaperone DnaK